ncbi:MAG: hypothetical protein CSA96_08740 [Bacteroidetes bacterium]|nr:MAG: hypothetical protein CSA96_08740 [Bacteroidota bacterium]
MDDSEFWMVGEVYNYNINNGRWFDFGDKKVDFFAQEIHSLINFGFKYDAEKDYESLFSSYSRLLHNELKGQGVLNYLSSHDDGHPFDPERNRPMEAATKLLLSPGASQIYYGDELCRPLIVDGAEGDANLRSLMDWSLIGSEDTANANKILEHYQKLGRFRRGHPAVGAGIHQMISKEPYLFSRSYEDASLEDLVLIGLDLEPGLKILKTGSVFKDGSELRDAYSGWTGKVRNGQVSIDSEHGIVLLEKLEKAL